MDGQGERQNIKVCEETDTMKRYMNEGKSQDANVKTYEVSYPNHPNHPNHLVLPHCAAVICSHLLETADW